MSNEEQNPPETSTRLARVWDRVLAAGDVSGRLLRLIALPSAVLAVCAFYDEIWDTLTPPSVTAMVQSVGLRCALAFDVIPDGVDRYEYANKMCEKSPLSAWVKLELSNDDSIDRTLIAVALRVHFPSVLDISDKPLFWTEARVVNHVLQNDYQTDLRSPWQPMLLAADQARPVEIDFRAFERENQKPFNLFKNLILRNPSPLDGINISVEVLGRFSWSDDWANLGACEIPIPAESIDRKRQAKPIRALTRGCMSSP